MQIIYESGYAIDKDVDIIINSANNMLLLGSGGAGRIRDKAQGLGMEWFTYQRLLKQLPKPTRDWYAHEFKQHGWQPSKAVLPCLRILIKEGPVPLGRAVYDGKFIHAVAMGYDLAQPDAPRIHATKRTIHDAARAAFTLAREHKKKSVAIPVMCARPEYGITPKDSLAEILKALRGFAFDHVIICFDNKATQELLKRMKKSGKLVKNTGPEERYGPLPEI